MFVFLSGGVCDKNIDDCIGDPCSAIGTVDDGCHDRVADYHCQCKPGYTGHNCSVSMIAYYEKRIYLRILLDIL